MLINSVIGMCLLFVSILHLSGIHAKHFDYHDWQLYLLWVKKPEVLSSRDVVEARILEFHQSLNPNERMNQVDDALNHLALLSFQER